MELRDGEVAVGSLVRDVGKAGSQGLDTWYEMRGRLKGDDEPDPVRGPNVDGLDDVPPEAAAGAHEGWPKEGATSAVRKGSNNANRWSRFLVRARSSASKPGSWCEGSAPDENRKQVLKDV